MENEAQRAGILIKQISELSDKQVNSDMKRYNVTCSQMRVLMCISRKNNTSSQKEIETFLHVAHPTVVGIIAGLEEKGMVTCAFDAADKRQKNIYLTAEAEKLLAAAKNYGDKMGDVNFKDFSDNEIATLIRLLEKMKQNILENQL